MQMNLKRKGLPVMALFLIRCTMECYGGVVARRMIVTAATGGATVPSNVPAKSILLMLLLVLLLMVGSLGVYVSR